MSWEQVAIGLAVGIPSLVIAILGYLRSREVDAVSEKSGLMSDARAGTAQIIEGLKVLVDNLQEDNQSFRTEIKYLAERLGSLTKDLDACKAEVARLYKRYGNGGEPKEA